MSFLLLILKSTKGYACYALLLPLVAPMTSCRVNQKQESHLMARVASRAGGVEMPARVARPAAAGGVTVRAAQDCRCVACAYKREGGRASVCQMSARPISEFSSRASSHRSGSDISSQRFSSAWANEKFDELPIRASSQRHSSALDAPRASSLSRHSSALDMRPSSALGMRPPSSVLKPWTWSRGYSNPISAVRTVLDDDEKIRELTYRNDFAVRRAMGGYY